MTRLTRSGCALAVALVTAVAGAPTALAAAQPSTETIRLGIRFEDTPVDLGTAGPSLGDVQVLNDKLLDRRGKVVGHNGGVCTVTSLDPPETSCSVTFSLPRGQIAVQFLNSPPPRKTAAVVGGTKRYRGVRGQLILVEKPDQTGSVTFRLTRR